MLKGFGERVRGLDEESKSGLPSIRDKDKEAAASSSVSHDCCSLGRWGTGCVGHNAAREENASKRGKKRCFVLGNDEWGWREWDR